MPGHYIWEACLCKRNEEIFCTAKHFWKYFQSTMLVSRLWKCLGLAWNLLRLHFETVRSAVTKVSSFPLPTLLTELYPSPGLWHEARAGEEGWLAAQAQRGQVIVVWRQLLEVQGSQCPLASASGQLVLIKLLTHAAGFWLIQWELHWFGVCLWFLSSWLPLR